MRDTLARTLAAHAADPRFVFLTGDVGFISLDPVRQAAPDRFINAGIAEQNMISVAAGLAYAGLMPWVYSIAPFIYARAFEQIRNDVCMHDFPVFLIGNGGGYGYGVMGPTHHALEDYGTLLGLPNLTVHVPAFATDVPSAIARLMAMGRPGYLRLGLDEAPKDWVAPAYAQWRLLLPGSGATILVVGPLAGGILAAARALPRNTRPSLWVLSELPIGPAQIPAEFIADFRRSEHLIVVEEHVAHGSAGAALIHALAGLGMVPRRFSHRHARGYPSGCYGSQEFHRKECALDPSAILQLASATA